MSLTAADVAEIMRLVEQSSFDELTLEVDGMKLCLRRGAGVSTTSGEPSPAVNRTNGASPSVAPSPTPAPEPPPPQVLTSTRSDPNVQDVVAPLLGTFYRAPKPGAKPFVEIGSMVEEDTVIAIIEVMKLMNSVRAGIRGTVTEVLVTDGSLVEYEQVLLRVRKAG